MQSLRLHVSELLKQFLQFFAFIFLKIHGMFISSPAELATHWTIPVVCQSTQSPTSALVRHWIKRDTLKKSPWCRQSGYAAKLHCPPWAIKQLVIQTRS